MSLTIVERCINNVPQSVAVFRAFLTQISQDFSNGECVEPSFNVSSRYVYKNVQIHSGFRDNGFRIKDENNISIEEYKLENPHKILKHPSKCIGYTTYDFVLIKQEEKVEVSRFIFKSNGLRELISHSLYLKQDNFNRNWEDVPVNDEILSGNVQVLHNHF